MSQKKSRYKRRKQDLPKIIKDFIIIHKTKPQSYKAPEHASRMIALALSWELPQQSEHIPVEIHNYHHLLYHKSLQIATGGSYLYVPCSEKLHKCWLFRPQVDVLQRFIFLCRILLVNKCDVHNAVESSKVRLPN